MTTINLSTYVVRAADGSLDLDGTCAKFAGDLLKYQAERETEESTIADAVAAVFDQFKGTRMNMPAVCSLSLQKLNVQPENFKVLNDKVADYIRSHAGKRETGAIFGIGKGKKGGCVRWCDQPADAKEPE